jgi:hypothetical protein
VAARTYAASKAPSTCARLSRIVFGNHNLVHHRDQRRGKAKLVGADGQARLLPDSLYSFLVEVIGLLNEGKSAYIVQNQAKLTTVEAAAMLGVSRQFLVTFWKREKSLTI